jgi:phage shock protein PspC (stress-responsive transcriptional regulator)
MKGDILDFSIQSNSGLISGEDGKRYTFAGAEWKDSNLPTRGLKVDYDVQDGKAVAVYLAIGTSATVGSVGTLDKRPLEYQGFYRSSDEKTLGGVCGGLAHKWGMNRSVVQLIFLILGILYFIGLLVYIVFWIAFKAVPTKGVKFA